MNKQDLIAKIVKDTGVDQGRGGQDARFDCWTASARR